MPRESGRQCQGCGARLAWDNQDAFCSPCRKTRHSYLDPPDVPADFWETPQFQAAFAEWHIGRVIYAYRHHPFHGPKPLPQTLVAGWLDLSQVQISRVETGPPVTDLDKLIPWARTLGVPERRLWFKVERMTGRLRVRDAGEASPAYTQSESLRRVTSGTVMAGMNGANEEESTKRRQALGTMGLTLVGGLGATRDEFPVLAPTTSPIGPSDIPVIRGVLSALTASERQFGGCHAREYATDYLTRVIQPRLHSATHEQTRQELFTVATEFTLRVASMQLDAGHDQVSRRLLATATTLAGETDDLTLSAWTLARHGEHAIRERKIDRAIAFTGSAVAMARSSPPGARSFILAKHALALSMSRNKAETLRALGRLWDGYNRVSSDAEPSWMQHYSWANLRHDEGRCFNNLGMGDKAAQAASDSLSKRTVIRPRAFSLGAMAIGYAQAGHLDQACATTHDMIALMHRLDSYRVRDSLRKVIAVLRQHRTAATVRDVFDAAHAVLP